MNLLNSLDLAVIVLYLIGITYIGSRFYQKGVGLKEYLLGNNIMKWFPVALSILAADTSAITYLGTPAWTFQHDMKLSWGILAYFLAIPVVIWLFLPIYSKGNLYTAYEFLERRFDLRVRLLASLFFLLVRGTHVAVIIYTPALVMSELMGFSLQLSIFAMGALTALYTTLGGIKAVIWTDTIQVGMVFLGFSLLAASALTHIPGGLQEVWTVGLAHSKFDLFDFSFSWDRVDNFWGLMLGCALIATQAMSTDQSVLQKFFTTKSSHETTKSLLFYGAVLIPLNTLLSLLGVLLFVFYSSHPEMRATLHNPDAVVPHYAAKMLPHGLAGVLVASVFAGSMSTVSASINSLATSSVVDIYRRLIYRGQTDRHYTLASRWATLLWGALATTGALYANRLGTLVLAFVKVQSLMGGVILGIFLLGVATRRIGSTDVIVGTVLGLALVIYAAVFTSVSIYWYCVIGCLNTLLGSWLYNRLFARAVVPQGAV
jgi:SSS family transporter